MSRFSENPILWEVENHVIYIQINRPDRENCLNCRDSEELARVYQYASDHPEIRVIVVTGSDGYFHTGGRLNSEDPEEKERFSRALRTRNQIIHNFRIPLIAAVNGKCLGGGMSLLLYADVAFAAESARFGYPEILRGSFPVMSMVATMPVLPKKKALEAFYSGRSFTAREALDMGLVNQVVPDGSLDETVRCFAEKLASLPTQWVQEGRAMYYRLLDMTPPERAVYLKETGAGLACEIKNGKEQTI